MTRCLDEATLQAYFDGELAGEMMESATLHLASCSTCAAAAREIEAEIDLMMTALAPEFAASVPTERLRQRLDAAVLEQRISAASAPKHGGFGAFISSLLSLVPQRTLGFASLVMLLAFAAIFGYLKLRTTPEQPHQIAVAPPQAAPKQNEPTVLPIVSKDQQPADNNSSQQLAVDKSTVRRNRPAAHTAVKTTETATPAPTSEPVKLLPGERAYLQTIARLDSTINANKKSMRPSLQVEYERNLAVVDRAIAATRTAAKSNPNDPDAADFMFAAYQSKVDLLNTIADARLGGGRSH